MNLTFAFHDWRRNLGNLALFKYRNYQGFIVSGQHSGTHWIKFMLNLAIADHYDLPPPKYVDNPSSNDFIGHPKHPRLHPHTPRIAMSHTIPHPFFRWKLTHNLVKFPRYVLLVRDIRAALVSHYEKWHEEYAISFSEFVKGNVNGKAHWADIWWHIRFCNGWGAAMEQIPEQILTVHYEDLINDALKELHRVRNFLEIDLSDTSLRCGVDGSSKKYMASLVKSGAKGGHSKFVRIDSRDPLDWYSDQDIQTFKNIVRNNLKYGIGYDYESWQSIKSK